MSLADGLAARELGRWQLARTAFEAALAEEPSAAALDGLGEVWWWLGDPRRSNDLRQQAYARFRRDGDVERAISAALGIAITYEANFGNNPAAGGWVGRAGRLLSGAADPMRPYVESIRAYVMPHAPTAVDLYREVLAAAAKLGDVDLELTALSGLGEKLVLAGDPTAGLPLIDEAMAGALGGECSRLETVVYTSCDMLVACDVAHDLARATRWCEVADRFIADYGCPFLYARCRSIYGGLLVSAGRWPEGERELQAAIAMAGGSGPAVTADAAARLADLRLRQGRVEEAVASLRGHEDQARAHLTAAALRLARGDATGAVQVLRRRLDQAQLEAAPALALLVRACLARTDLDAAREAGAHLARLAEGRAGTYPAALAATAHARLAAANEWPDEARRWWETALAAFVGLDMPHEVGRVRLELARSLVDTRPDEATAEAEAAFTAFEELGARLDADEAAALLRILGAPPARSGPGPEPGELTTREREVLRLVGLGLTNPEIAARLHISRKTAAHHVSRVLAKLGARNRTEAAALVEVEVSRRPEPTSGPGAPPGRGSRSASGSPSAGTRHRRSP